MKRPCTDNENKIIKSLILDSLPDLALSSTNISTTIPFIVGIALGFLVGLPLAAAVKAFGEIVMRLVLIVSLAFTEGLCMLIWQIRTEKRTGRKSKEHISVAGSFQVNGGTVLDIFRDEQNNLHYIFTEDDLLDPFRNPYKIQHPVYGAGYAHPGERLLLIYTDAGDYIPMRIDTQTFQMIPPTPPAYFEKTDWNACSLLPHPNAAEIDQTAFRVPSGEIAALKKRWAGRKGLKVMLATGVRLLVVALLSVFVLIFCILVGSGFITTGTGVVTAGIVLAALWVFLSFMLANRVQSAAETGFDKFLYRKKVLFHSSETTAVSYDSTITTITVYEYEAGVIEKKSYSYADTQFLPKDLRPGTIIVKYTTGESSKWDSGILFATAQPPQG